MPRIEGHSTNYGHFCQFHQGNDKMLFWALRSLGRERFRVVTQTRYYDIGKTLQSGQNWVRNLRKKTNVPVDQIQMAYQSWPPFLRDEDSWADEQKKRYIEAKRIRRSRKMYLALRQNVHRPHPKNDNKNGTRRNPPSKVRTSNNWSRYSSRISIYGFPTKYGLV